MSLMVCVYLGFSIGLHSTKWYWLWTSFSHSWSMAVVLSTLWSAAALKYHKAPQHQYLSHFILDCSSYWFCENDSLRVYQHRVPYSDSLVQLFTLIWYSTSWLSLYAQMSLFTFLTDLSITTEGLKSGHFLKRTAWLITFVEYTNHLLCPFIKTDEWTKIIITTTVNNIDICLTKGTCYV